MDGGKGLADCFQLWLLSVQPRMDAKDLWALSTWTKQNETKQNKNKKANQSETVRPQYKKTTHLI